MAQEPQESIEKGYECFDDDGRIQRTGTLLTASAHIITAVIGSGILSLPWVIAQLGWLLGIIALIIFPLISWLCCILQADCYRDHHGKRNYTYMHAVRANLGGVHVTMCGVIQYVVLIGVTIGYAITSSTSMAAVKRSNCFHKNGHDVPCEEPVNRYMIIFACMEIILSQIPNFHKIWWLSIVATVTAVIYSSIGIGLSIAKIAEGTGGRTTLTGVEVGVDVFGNDKVWRSFQSLGNLAVGFSFSLVLIEIQDTLKSSPPENKVMKKASFIGVVVTTFLYSLCGLVGYAAFGNKAPSNFLTGFGVYEPYWLLNIGNICIVVHVVGAYQVFSQPIFQVVENWTRNRWPDQGFLTFEQMMKVPLLGDYSVNYFRVIWRTIYVILTTLIAIIFPFFGSFLGLLGATSFWPITVYFPVEMYLKQAKIQRFSATWTGLKLLSSFCLAVSLLATCGAIQSIVEDLQSQSYKPFRF